MFEDNPIYGENKWDIGTNLHDYARDVRSYYDDIPFSQIDQVHGPWAPTEYWNNPLGSIENFLTSDLRTVNEKQKNYMSGTSNVQNYFNRKNGGALNRFINGGQLPKAQDGTQGGSLNDVFDINTKQFINGWNANNIGNWKSERGYTFDNLLQYMAFTQTTPGGLAVDQAYGNRFNESFDWSGKNFGGVNEEYLTNFFRDQIYPGGAPDYKDPRFNKGNAYGNINDFDLTGWD